MEPVKVEAVSVRPAREIHLSMGTLVLISGIAMLLFMVSRDVGTSVTLQKEQTHIARATFWAEHPYAARWRVRHGRTP